MPGEQGEPGNPGVKGALGRTGPRGRRGDHGEKGPRGEQGMGFYKALVLLRQPKINFQNKNLKADHYLNR